MEASNKSPEMTEFLDQFSKAAFGRTRTEAIELGVCVDCGQPAKDFRDAISQKEYTISGLCQSCQDKIFGEE